MRVKGMGIIKRGIAVGLIALMACTNPLQTLSPANGSAAQSDDLTGQPTVASAAEKAAPYVGEVRLAVDKKADKAKQILEDAGYEVIDQDLNEKAGSFWNKLGDQAVYMGIKRTDDSSKAIRDMKTMNMLGKYSYSDLKEWVEGNRQEAREKCAPLFIIRDEFKKNVENGDIIAKNALEAMNHIKESDSGMGVGDFLLSDDCGEDGVIKVLVEGNGDLVSSIMELLYMGCEMKDDTWLQRLSKTTNKSLTRKYTRELYHVDVVYGAKAMEVEKRMYSDLYETSQLILANWDSIRDELIETDKELELTPKEEETLEDDEVFESFLELRNAEIKLRNNTLTSALKKISYNGRTLLDFFTLDKKAFEKNITRLYPVAAALSDGQKALLKFSNLADLANTAIARAETRETGKLSQTKVDPDKCFNDCPLYAGVDRAMFRDGAAMTSRATADFAQASGNPIALEYALYVSCFLTLGAFVLTLSKYSERNNASGAYHYFVEKYNNAHLDLFKDKNFSNYLAKKFSTPEELMSQSMRDALEEAEESVAQKIADGSIDLDADDIFLNAQDKDFLDNMKNSYNEQESLADDTFNQSQRAARVALVISVIMVIVSTTLYIIHQRETHNREQLAIPTVIVDRDVESTITGYVAYSCVLWNRDRNDDSGRDNRGDLNGDAGDQWLALYTTRDRAMGAPILADSIITKVGDSGIPNADKGGNYVPLTMFGRDSVQNLVDKTYSYNDEVGGIYLWYMRATGDTSTVIDDVDDEKQETEAEVTEAEASAEEATATPDSMAETTASNIGGSNSVFGIVGGAVGGFILGMVCMFFIRRKKVATVSTPEDKK